LTVDACTCLTVNGFEVGLVYFGIGFEVLTGRRTATV
jgi:hypothetical protein